ncbi:MAG: DNA cytosine methyltransferase [Rhodospirillaceae bacterium]|jgi:DNA (cytosine-5)-methyltransferase 1|nr:DNA cytosine methyltransferase [Rhodospirillaceae bacterium]MBT3883537.1 DNA cytosine methyltransferase [Rhodospirillaceae bacterium]MBT4118097.1 DNA cytosine methyltransferase [Rhodospirillaceae bacterium]MBT4670911.1 DNA cytosine methyltransferase [Rhodospirillaceae bacterium]MBT4721864.1 DNA cytosine methyltransferase [Rhodospirillaceae bacterium]
MQPTAIDLFCGAGGLSEGFRQAGFRILAGNDIDRYGGQTFAATHPEALFIPGPIEDISAAELLKTVGLDKGELDCLIGGPPCQSFSVYNHQRGLHDVRSGLFREYLRIVEGLLPRWVVMENVTGITSVGGGEAVAAIHKCLGDLGYHVEMKILRAEEYGVPQERRRIFFVGNRLDIPIAWPEPTHGPNLEPFITVWDAIADLPSLKNGEDPGGPLPYRTESICAYQAMLRGNSIEITNHAAPRLAPINLERMKFIPEGGSWRDVPIELLPEGMKRARRCDHTKRYGRLRKKGLASTILTKCDLHWGAYIHPEQDRVLTVREAARMQSFPDWFDFAGPRTEQYIQVGNAVPPQLGRKVAEAVLESLSWAESGINSSPMLATA